MLKFIEKIEFQDADIIIQQLNQNILRISKFSKIIPISENLLQINQQNLGILLGPLDSQEKKSGEGVKNNITYTVDEDSQTLSFSSNGEEFLKENGFRFKLHQNPNSKKPLEIMQNFSITEPEGLFGLGQHQVKNLNWRGTEVSLEQHNTIASIPILLSTKGYAILWENLGGSHFSESNNIVTFQAKRAEAINYWIIYGPTFDEIIHNYRDVTGSAQMFAKWGYGFIQSRNRYSTRDEVMGVVEKHRKLKLPIDIIVIDYIYYGKHGCGSHLFDEDDYPNPKSMIEEFHNKHNVKLLLSIWPTFHDYAYTFKEMNEKGFILDCNSMCGKFYDPFNPEAGKKFWSLLRDNFFSMGVDAWWLDASEPDDEEKFSKIDTYFGNGADYLNIYSLQHTQNVYLGQMEADPEKRPFILTRSAFIGQQRNASGTWSGDVKANWKDYQKQIPSGLNFCAAGIPYWCTDIGGYRGGWHKNPRYRELFTRWFQYGTFLPIFRSHGRRWPLDRTGKNEIWEFGRRVTKIAREFSNIRYKLYPYIYSIAWKIYNEGYTMMRLMAFDYPDDPNVYEINDQFLFGPSMLICPVMKYMQRKRKLYLPKGEWYDYWTNERLTGGNIITAKAPLSRIPIYIKAGSIIPTGPIVQYSTEWDWKSFDLNVYPGKDTEFNLYLDDGDTNNYQKGKYALIQIKWSDNESTCEITEIYNGYLKSGEKLSFTIKNIGSMQKNSEIQQYTCKQDGK